MAYRGWLSVYACITPYISITFGAQARRSARYRLATGEECTGISPCLVKYRWENSIRVRVYAARESTAPPRPLPRHRLPTYLPEVIATGVTSKWRVTDRAEPLRVLRERARVPFTDVAIDTLGHVSPIMRVTSPGLDRLYPTACVETRLVQTFFLLHRTICVQDVQSQGHGLKNR